MAKIENNRLLRPDTGKPQPKIGIVHLGLGAFYRAHGAIYIGEAMRESGGDWGILGVSLMRPTQRDQLAPQGFAYTALELGPEGETAQIIDVVQNVMVAREDPAAVVAAMADPGVKIVSLTVTEKGYCHEPSTGELNMVHPDIIYDISNLERPRSALGYLVSALAARKAAGVAPFTVLCCDNLPENGAVVRGVVLALAGLIDSDLAAWIAQNGAFPSTMVDRIVPATKDEDIARVEELTGFHDASPVMHEPFRQWVVEDNFVGERPDFAAVGVQMVSSVTDFENMKLRCLNGTHSTLAYLGYLAGYETISDTVADKSFAKLCQQLWAKEIILTLNPPEGEDLAAYAEALLLRYENPAIRHLTWQIAMDGSQKLPQRILGTITDNLAAERDCRGLILAVAAWMIYVGGTDEKGATIDVRDPLAEQMRGLGPDELLAITAIFPENLATSPAFRAPVLAAYTTLKQKGARACVAEIAHD